MIIIYKNNKWEYKKYNFWNLSKSQSNIILNYQYFLKFILRIKVCAISYYANWKGLLKLAVLIIVWFIKRIN